MFDGQTADDLCFANTTLLLEEFAFFIDVPGCYRFIFLSIDLLVANLTCSECR